MKSKATARAVTILILSGALVVVAVRKSDFRPRLEKTEEAKPQDAIYAMLDAARAGDVERYLASYTGEIAQALARAKSESPDFVKYLRDSNAALKGVAVMEPQPLPDGQMEFRVEYVYEDRSEAQLLFLMMTPDGWKVSRVETAERVKTIIPYGTPVQ